MSKIVAFTHLTLDGVMQGPGRPDEDCRDGFAHSGWAAPYNEGISKTVAQSMGNAGALLFGRKTYEDFYRVWPSRTDSPFTPVLNNSLKYVASRTLEEPLPWMNSQLLRGDAENTVATLRSQPGKDIVVLGSGALLHSLLRRNLVDELMLTIHPIVLGSGRRLFPDGGPAASLRLVNTETTSKGSMIVIYQPTAT